MHRRADEPARCRYPERDGRAARAAEHGRPVRSAHPAGLHRPRPRPRGLGGSRGLVGACPGGRIGARRRRAADDAGADPGVGTRTTARDMVRLLRLLWSGQAGPAEACARVRAVMGRQLTRHRIASGFRTPVRVAAKSGGLAGIVRDEVGVVSYPDGRRYAAAVFTRSSAGADDAAINAAIGTATAHAIASLHRETA
ncbi:serine hydrolase [Streptomyces sp. HF10]|uniref:serine hydrolase n=1 Tax=Streptomyces sp. HF10 TaxID=2692233 RepID=UPI0022A8D169|nr:serine hydrolase [Streptomyces sp. HF10]